MKNLIAAATRCSLPQTPMIRYMGTSITSQKVKNRIMSSETRQPIMPVSSTSIAATNSAPRLLIDFHAPQMHSGVSSVVRRMMNSEKPSTATW